MMTVVPILARDTKYYEIFTPKGLDIIVETPSRTSNPERVASFAFNRSLDSTLSGLEFLWCGLTQGSRFAATLGYGIKPLRGKELRFRSL